MQEATTRFATENGQKYLTQLCKHFAHKIDVAQADDQGELRFSCGTGISSSRSGWPQHTGAVARRGQSD